MNADFPWLVTFDDLKAMLVTEADWAAMQPTRADLERTAAGPPGLVQKMAGELLAGRPDAAVALLPASVRAAYGPVDVNDPDGLVDLDDLDDL